MALHKVTFVMSNSFLRMSFTAVPACQSCSSRVYGVLFASLFLQRTLGGTSVTITRLAPMASSVLRTSRMFVATIAGKSSSAKLLPHTCRTTMSGCEFATCLNYLFCTLKHVKPGSPIHCISASYNFLLLFVSSRLVSSRLIAEDANTQHFNEKKNDNTVMIAFTKNKKSIADCSLNGEYLNSIGQLFRK